MNKIKAWLSSRWPEYLHPMRMAYRYLIKASRGKVMSGPFQGMPYRPCSVMSAMEPKLMGTYELELHPVIEAICEHPPGVVVDVGAAEGYYATGLAWRCPGVAVEAFEALPTGQSLLHAQAKAAGVSDRIQISGHCETTHLRALTEGQRAPFILMDVEGGEVQLLDPELVPGLKQCEILVELHEHISPGVSNLIRERFQGTHDVQLIWEQARTREVLPIRSMLWDRWLEKLLREFRPVRMSWFHLIPKSRHAH